MNNTGKELTTKEIFENFRKVMLNLPMVDSFWWQSSAPHTTQNNKAIGRYIQCNPSRYGFSADSRMHYSQWRFLCYYIADDIEDHLDFIDYCDKFQSTDVIATYMQHRIVGWKPYTIVQINSLSDWSTDPFADFGTTPQPR